MRRIHQPKYNPLTCVPVCGHAWNPRRHAVYVAIGKLREARRRAVVLWRGLRRAIRKQS